MSANVQSLLHEAAQLTPDERLQLIRGLEALPSVKQDQEKPDYLALFGSGQGGYATPNEADEFIRRERDAWEN